ncbi:hypothetical protein [Mesobacillus foraminis]|uniref:Uncharacterized protein n=1 Tax=Mesobacillus foraminis TaxID=279826 RepID=A0A4R2BJ19_9BACI|nr:hypothetical protein [Mesobacillus foraminis]TCN25964.1 hypothetical protein EV146_10471 [Mesobacillus foraminis]
MIGLILAIILFNFIAFKTNRRHTQNSILHIWLFTIAFQLIFDTMIEFKYHGYWYFDKEVDWLGLLAHTLLIPPVNMIFLNWYPLQGRLRSRILYTLIWVAAIMGYELLTLLPEPWGYFHYGWWNLWYAAILDPFLFYILIKFYRWIRSLEERI